jgi:phosphoenolpyruvate synthase/pyruvate phosphate dikinase
MSSYVLEFNEINQSQVALVGGKGAHLGELSQIEGIQVPTGFCVTTYAFHRIMADAPSIAERLHRLSSLNLDDREAISTVSAEIRWILGGVAIPDELAAAITGSVAQIGEQAAYAVRSSATAEDLPTPIRSDTCPAGRQRKRSAGPQLSRWIAPHRQLARRSVRPTR